MVREDPDREGLLYAGTEFGMFISFDNGAHWQSFQQNLPNVPINDIRVYRKDLIVATQGRAMWIMHNVSPLHQITPKTSASAVAVYTPRDGYRTATGTTFNGPNIDYFLPATPADTVRLEIVDAQGKVVNSYKSDAPPPGAGRGGRGGGGGDMEDPDASDGGGRGRGGPQVGPPLNVVTKKPGMNRFAWGMQYQSTIGAPPGRYQARLTVDGATQTVPFTVLIDPRLAAEGLTAADLREQFEHNTRVRALVTDANAAVARARAETRLRGATGAAADTLAKVQAVNAKLLTQAVRYGKPGLQAHINYLSGMTQRVDQKVGRDALARYAALRKELDQVMAELARALGLREIASR